MNLAVDTNCILPGKVGGIEDYTVALIEALCLPHGPARKVFLLSRPENREMFSALFAGRCEVIEVPRPLHRGQPVGNWDELRRHSPRIARGLQLVYSRAKTRMLAELEVDLVHFPGNTINPIELNLSAVLNLHDLQHRHFPQYFTKSELENREKWWTASAQRADALIAASAWIADDLHTQLGIEKSKIFVTPEPMRQAHSDEPSLGSLSELRRRLKLPISFFLYPAAYWPHKNHHRLLRAFAEADLPGVQLLLTGGGQEESPLPELIESLGLTGRVRLMGRVSTADLAGMYRLATALIFPSQHEAWSLPIAEAMSAGCPVASSDVTSLPEQVGDAGLRFPADDIPAMAAAMRQLADDESLQQTLAAKGKQRAAQFSPERFLQTVADAYAYARSARAQRKAA